MVFFVQKENIESRNDAKIAKLSYAEVFGFFCERTKTLIGAGCGVITLPATYENTVDVQSDACSLDGLDWLIPFYVAGSI
jgi:hypothetical protein